MNPISKEKWEAKKNVLPVRIQWDPERDLLLRPLEHRAIQIGLDKETVPLYVDQWIQRITDVTPLAHSIHKLIQGGESATAYSQLPQEREYNSEHYQ